MRVPDGSHGPELGGAKDMYVWGFIVGAVLFVGGFVPLVALSALNETAFEVPGGVRAGFAGAGVVGLGTVIASILLMKFDPPPNPY